MFPPCVGVSLAGATRLAQGVAIISCCCFRLGIRPAFLHAWYVWPLICAKLPFLCLTSKLFYIKGERKRLKKCVMQQPRLMPLATPKRAVDGLANATACP